jgi:hypothetical protein
MKDGVMVQADPLCKGTSGEPLNVTLNLRIA